MNTSVFCNAYIFDTHVFTVIHYRNHSATMNVTSIKYSQNSCSCWGLNGSSGFFFFGSDGSSSDISMSSSIRVLRNSSSWFCLISWLHKINKPCLCNFHFEQRASTLSLYHFFYNKYSYNVSWYSTWKIWYHCQIQSFFSISFHCHLTDGARVCWLSYKSNPWASSFSELIHNLPSKSYMNLRCHIILDLIMLVLYMYLSQDFKDCKLLIIKGRNSLLLPFSYSTCKSVRFLNFIITSTLHLLVIHSSSKITFSHYRKLYFFFRKKLWSNEKIRTKPWQFLDSLVKITN